MKRIWFTFFGLGLLTFGASAQAQRKHHRNIAKTKATGDLQHKSS